MTQRPRERYRNVLNEAFSCSPSSQNTSLAKVSTHTLSVQESNVSYPITFQENSQTHAYGESLKHTEISDGVSACRKREKARSHCVCSRKSERTWKVFVSGSSSSIKEFFNRLER